MKSMIAKLSKKLSAAMMVIAIGFASLAPTAAFAAADDCTPTTNAQGVEVWEGTGCEFAGGWQTVVDWSQGSFGKLIAGAFVLIGAVAGIARQSLMAFGTGAGAGLGLGIAPGVIDSMFTATVVAGADTLPFLMLLQ